MFGKKRDDSHLILKFLLLTALLIVLFAPFASAKIVILNNFRDMYNLGDTVTIDGYIVATTTADDLVSLELQCPGYSKVNSVNLKINKGQKVTFSTLGISNFIIPRDIEGVCDVEATFNEESANSDSFTVLNDLLGSFEVSEDEYQLGDTITFSGIVFKLDGSDVSGTATIFLKKEGSYAVQFDTQQVTNGAIDYSKVLSNLEYGKYYLDVKVADDLGNSQYFESVDFFTINTILALRASTSKYQYWPGDEVVVSGEIDTTADTLTIDVTILFDSLRYTTKPSGKNFEYRFFVPKNMNAGDYKLEVKIKDSYGNAGSDDFILTIKQIPTTISNDIPETSYEPGDTLFFEINLFDQSGNTMNADVQVSITDPDSNVLYTGIVNTAQDIELEFGKYATPGTYTITSIYSEKDLEDTDRVTVAEVRGITSDLEGETITLKNDGNVVYNDRVDLILVREQNGKEIYYVLAKDITIEPGKEQIFDLSYEVPIGEYTILIDDDTSDISAFDDEELAFYISNLKETTDAKYDGVSFSEDNRAFGKKVDQGLSSITGATAISTYDRSITPWFLLFILFIFGGLLGLYGYQHRTVIQQAYENYKKRIKQKAEEEGGFLSTIRYKGSDDTDKDTSGDVPEEEVAKLLAAQGELTYDSTPKQESCTGTAVPHAELRSHQKNSFQALKKPILLAKIDPVSGKTINRFSTWSPPSTITLNEKTFPAKNPVKEPSAVEKDKEKALYEDIDEDFLRDEKF